MEGGSEGEGGMISRCCDFPYIPKMQRLVERLIWVSCTEYR